MIRPDVVEEVMRIIRQGGYLSKLMRIPFDEKYLGGLVYRLSIRVMKNCLLGGDEYKMRGFGTLKVIYREAYHKKNNLTGKPMYVDARVRVKFFPSRGFTRQLKAQLLQGENHGSS